MKIEEKKQLLENITRDFLGHLGFNENKILLSHSATENENDKENILITVEIEVPKTDSRFLIGWHGSNLNAIRHLLYLIIQKNSSAEQINFQIDINDYRKGQTENLLSYAKEAAEKAIRDKKTVILRPMSAFERRLVHTELSKIDGIKTESVGENEDRKILIKFSGILS